MKTTTATSQMLHTRPFRWRRKQQQAAAAEQQLSTASAPETPQLHQLQHHRQHHRLGHHTLRSSAICHHHHHQEHHSLSYEQVSMCSLNVCCASIPDMAAPLLSSTIAHSQRYSPRTTTSNSAAATRRQDRRGNSLSSSSTLAVSLPKLMSLSIIVCVVLSLLNLTNDQMQLKMVVAIGPTGQNSAASSSNVGGATQTTSQSKATLQQQQQQQSNSVISFPTVSSAFATMPATATTTSNKAKYKTMYACEDRQLTMECETGTKINLIRANFGRFSITQCNEQGQLDLAIDCMSPLTFRIMQELCQDQQRCSVNATSALFTDRCPMTRKYLEVHFQCLPTLPTPPERVTLPQPNQTDPVQTPLTGVVPPMGPPRPPNNPQHPNRPPIYQPPVTEDSPRYQPQPPFTMPEQHTQIARPVINSQVMTPAMAINHFYKSQEPGIIVSLRHLGTEFVAQPRCYQWDPLSNQWTERGARILETNQTHTVCAFDQETSYVLVMDYSGPTIQPISPSKPPIINKPPFDGPPMPDILDSQPTPIDPISPNNPPGSHEDITNMIHAPMPDPQLNQPQQSSSRLFINILGIMFVAIALVTLTFVASSMRSSAGAALKSLGNFVPFNGPKYKHRRQNGVDPPSLHPNKDLLVINNSNGHSFIYAPASTTKISSSSSTHILSSGGQPSSGQHQAGTLHRLQQQQMYSGNGATLSSLSGTGAQSNNYYYGLMGLNPLLQQQHQQQHHFSQHHLNLSQPQQAQLVGQQQQVNSAANYNHQANKSSVSNDSANSSASSSGVESGSTSMQQHQQQQQQQQQVRTQQACLVSAMNNNDFHLMGHHISNYGQHQSHHQNLFATLKGASVTHQPLQHQPTFTVNSHYSASGVNVASGVQSINLTQNQQANAATLLHNRQASNQMRDHIYECVDDDKPYMARLLMPTQTSGQNQIFGSPTFMSSRRTTTTNDCNGRQK